MQSIQNLENTEGHPRVILMGTRRGLIRRLPGFKKHHFIPDNHTDATQTFVRSVAHKGIETVSSGLFQTLRVAFDLKRRELKYHCSEGFSSLESPDFELEVYADQDPEDATAFIETTQVVRLKSDAIANDTRFHHCFQNYCDTLRIDFPTGVCVEDKIDAVEDIPELAQYLEYEADGSALELKLPGIDLHIAMNSVHASFKLIGRRDLAMLFDHTQKTLHLLAPAGFPQSLAVS